MTASTDVTIWCDGKELDEDGQRHWDCGQWEPGDTASDVRSRLGAPGPGRWLVGLPGGRDLCPEHHDQRNDTTRHGDGSQ